MTIFKSPLTFNRIYDRKRKALVDLLLTQSTRSGATMAIVTTLIALVTWPSFPNWVVISWAAMGYFLNLSRSYIFMVVKKLAPVGSVYLWLENTLMIMLILTGLFWGSTCWLFLTTDDMPKFFFIALAVLVIPPSALPSFSALPYIWLVYSTPLLLLTAAKLYTVGFWELAILAIVNLLGLLPLSRNLGETIENSVTLDIRNSELLTEVQLAREKAEKTNLAKSQFLAAASHDLRQPLHAQGILLEVLNLRLEDKEQRELLNKVTQSNEVLNTLFNSLLEISQLDAGTIKVQKNHQLLMDICEPLVNEYRYLIQQEGLTIELTGDDVAVLTDPVLLSRILRNLVSNAIKFTAAGGVKVEIKSSANQVYLSVIDTGVGIPLPQQENIFNEYYQLDNKARDRNKGIGIGLGLALVRRMCELLKHNIRLESVAGEGACFTITLARGDAPKVVAPTGELEIELISDLDVLLIDSEQPILDAMTVMLSDWGCWPRAFTHLQAAEKMIESENYKPDLIISDYRLSGSNTGVDVIRKLQEKWSDKIPALIISGDTDPELLEIIHRQDYYLLHKPVKPARLKKLIHIISVN
jgi:signal transduction histidine kinase